MKEIPDIPSEKLVLDADQLLMIQMFILNQSKLTMVTLYSQINVIYEFSSQS